MKLTDNWEEEYCQSNRATLGGGVVSITFMHNFHTKVSTVNDISPSINYTALTVNYRLVEIETI